MIRKRWLPDDLLLTAFPESEEKDSTEDDAWMNGQKEKSAVSQKQKTIQGCC